MEDNLGVSLVKYLCPICCDVADEGIIMNSLLTKQNAEEVKKMHNKAIGFADHACKKCAEYKAVFFIGIDADKSEPGDPYRTGQIVGVKEDSGIVKHCKDYIITLKDGSKMCYMDEKAGKSIGLWQ